ncbi:MAG: FHA domain-containing protein [Deltaproteobacteria bacterium]|nr:MAG: FHA domain-containing protein [Deltaproteobacteria bacterium]
MLKRTTLIEEHEWSMGSARSETLSMQEATVVVTKGPHKGTKAPFNSDLFHIGRADWCDIRLPDDPWVSTHHCELRWTPDGIVVRDMGSSNGISVRDIRVFQAILPPKMPLRLGKSVLEVRVRSRTQDVEIPYQDDAHSLVGRSTAMRRIFDLGRRLQHEDLSILLLGETGTGKSSIAESFHRQSHRAPKPFVVVNCGAVAPSLIESSLFGYEKGAYSGADKLHKGYFEQAQEGTLFLDEVGELPLELQPRLLDVLERQKVRRLGAENEIDVDVRVIAATHKNLWDAVEQGLFREDLYYRLAVVDLHVPALRERMEDLPLLVDSLMEKLGAKDKNITLTTGARNKLQSYVWPGNIRQLRNVLNRAIALSDGVITPEDLSLPQADLSSPSQQEEALPTHSSTNSPFPEDWWEQSYTLKEILAMSEKALLLETLERYHWNVTQTAKKLQISRAWVYNRLKKYNIETPSFD